MEININSKINSFISKYQDIFNVFKCNKIIVSGAIDRTAVIMTRYQLMPLVSQRKQHTYTAKVLMNV